jgi:hypothetical protein
MLRPATIVALLLGVAFGAIGCASHVDLTPTRTIPMTLDRDKKVNEATISLQNLVAITLPHADPGYTWQISFHDPRLLKQMSELKPLAANAPATVQFLTIHTGRTHVRFLLLPPNAGRDARPVDQQEVVLTIQ